MNCIFFFFLFYFIVDILQGTNWDKINLDLERVCIVSFLSGITMQLRYVATFVYFYKKYILLSIVFFIFLFFYSNARMFDVFFSLIKNQSRNNILKFIFASKQFKFGIAILISKQRVKYIERNKQKYSVSIKKYQTWEKISILFTFLFLPPPWIQKNFTNSQEYSNHFPTDRLNIPFSKLFPLPK